VLGRMRAFTAETDASGSHARSWRPAIVRSALLTTMGSVVLTSIRLVAYEMEVTIRSTARRLSFLLKGKDNSKTNQLGLRLRSGQTKQTRRMILGPKVRTAAGSGTLIQVFAVRVTVPLDSERNKCSVFSPAQIDPVSDD
jgi:hypothetical protein